VRREVTEELLSASETLLAQVAEGMPSSEDRLAGSKLRALRRLHQLRETMTELVPQIHHWLKSGYVAAGKIVNLNLPEVRSIVRGKAGKKVGSARITVDLGRHFSVGAAGTPRRSSA
jgi:hypothetical protein